MLANSAGGTDPSDLSKVKAPDPRGPKLSGSALAKPERIRSWITAKTSSVPQSISNCANGAELEREQAGFKRLNHCLGDFILEALRVPR